MKFSDRMSSVMSSETKQLNIEVKAELKAAGEEGVFEGYASTFGNTDSVNDIIAQGAFADSLLKRSPKVLWQHKMDMPIGKCMEVREDERGLFVKVKLITETQLGADAYALVKEGVIDSLSIGFFIEEASYDTERGVRIIEKAELFEFSLVTIPANDKAVITSVKQELPADVRGFENLLRELGYDRRAAKTITSHGIKGYQDVLRDAGVFDSPDVDLRDADELKDLLSNLLDTMKGNENGRQGTKRTC